MHVLLAAIAAAVYVHHPMNIMGQGHCRVQISTLIMQRKENSGLKIFLKLLVFTRPFKAYKQTDGHIIHILYYGK